MKKSKNKYIELIQIKLWKVMKLYNFSSQMSHLGEENKSEYTII